jgi:DNA segregation ATPase FtsK/SpoIIIE-like protein
VKDELKRSLLPSQATLLLSRDTPPVLQTTARAQCRDVVDLGGPADQGEDAQDDGVVDHVSHDGRLDAVVQHQVEHHHAQEPGVDPAEQALVGVSIAELAVGHDHGCADHPGAAVLQEGLQRSEREEVGHRDDHCRVELLHHPKGDEVEELQRQRQAEEHHAPEEDLLEHAGVQADPHPLEEAGVLADRAEGSSVDCEHDDRAEHGPGEDEPHLAEALAGDAVTDQVADGHGQVVAPQEAQDRQDDRAAAYHDQVFSSQGQARDRKAGAVVGGPHEGLLKGFVHRSWNSRVGKELTKVYGHQR